MFKMTENRNKFDFGIARRSKTFLVIHHDKHGNREITDMNPAKFFQFKVESGEGHSADDTYISGISDNRYIRCAVTSENKDEIYVKSVFEKLLAASAAWVEQNTNLMMDSEFENVDVSIVSNKRYFFGFWRTNRQILYIDLTEIETTSHGRLIFKDGTSLEPCRRFYESIQDILYLSQDLIDF